MIEQLKGKLVKGPYKPIHRNCAIYFFKLIVLIVPPTLQNSNIRYQELPLKKRELPFLNHHFGYPAVIFRGRISFADIFCRILGTHTVPAFRFML